MQRLRAARLGWPIALAITVSTLTASAANRPVQNEASLKIDAGHQGCSVDLDSAKAGHTNTQGELLLDQVDPGDHYVHLACPGEAEQILFISLKVGEQLNLKPQTAGKAASPTELAENRLELQQSVQQATQLRAAGQFTQAIDRLRHAILLDNQNADLHRELGITFLMMRDWKRARIEYLETTRLDPEQAEAHNGLGYALEKLGELEQARNEFRLAMQLDPGDPTYREHYLEAQADLAAEKTKKR